MNKVHDLIDQIIEYEKVKDEKHKRLNECGNASQTVGESFTLFHLKILKKLIDENLD